MKIQQAFRKYSGENNNYIGNNDNNEPYSSTDDDNTVPTDNGEDKETQTQ